MVLWIRNSSWVEVELDMGIRSYEWSQLPVLIHMATFTSEIIAPNGMSTVRIGSSFRARLEYNVITALFPNYSSQQQTNTAFLFSPLTLSHCCRPSYTNNRNNQIQIIITTFLFIVLHFYPGVIFTGLLNREQVPVPPPPCKVKFVSSSLPLNTNWKLKNSSVHRFFPSSSFSPGLTFSRQKNKKIHWSISFRSSGSTAFYGNQSYFHFLPAWSCIQTHNMQCNIEQQQRNHNSHQQST